MSKPVLVVRLPNNNLGEYEIAKIQNYLETAGINEDYNILIVTDTKTDGNIKFECYNVPYSEIEFEELKERLLDLAGCSKELPVEYNLPNEPVIQSFNADSDTPYSPISFAYNQLIGQNT